MASNAPRYISTNRRTSVPTPKGVRVKAASGRWGPQAPRGRNNMQYFTKQHLIDPTPTGQPA